MVEGTGLENRHTGNGIVSSNLTLSVAPSVGQVAEWFKAQAWKACVRESVPWVRIPPCPLSRSELGAVAVSCFTRVHWALCLNCASLCR